MASDGGRVTGSNGGTFHQAPMRDPCAVLERAAFHAVLEALPVQDLAACLCVSQQWRDAALDERLWAQHVQELWKDKAYVPTHIRALPSKRRAYALSLQDAKRTAITEEELTGFTWLFHFKEDAGSWWTAIASKRNPVRRYFHRDHTMTRPREDPMSTFADQEYTWQFRKSKEGRRGTFVQINRYPSLEPKRTPDWGWEMENIWVTFRSDMAAGPNPGKGQERVSPPSHHQGPAHVHAVLAGHLAAQVAAGAGEEEHGGEGEGEDEGEQWDLLIVQALTHMLAAQGAAQAPGAAGEGGSGSSSDDEVA